MDQARIEELLSLIEREVGEVPDGMRYFSRLFPEMVEEHIRGKKFAFSQNAIPEKYRQLIIIAAAVASGTPACIKTQTKIALRKGITKDEIIEAILLGRFVLASTALANSAEALKEVDSYSGEER